MKRKFDVEVFKRAHKLSFETALNEIKQGRKQSHWMWYIFPQVIGLGKSEKSKQYAIYNLQEASEYMEDKYLSSNMISICEALLELKTSNPIEVFGSPDNLKLKSSMTLFYKATGLDVFKRVIVKFFNSELDHRTIDILFKSNNKKTEKSSIFIGYDCRSDCIAFNFYDANHMSEKEKEMILSRSFLELREEFSQNEDIYAHNFSRNKFVITNKEKKYELDFELSLYKDEFDSYYEPDEYDDEEDIDENPRIYDQTHYYLAKTLDDFVDKYVALENDLNVRAMEFAKYLAVNKVRETFIDEMEDPYGIIIPRLMCDENNELYLSMNVICDDEVTEFYKYEFKPLYDEVLNRYSKYINVDTNRRDAFDMDNITDILYNNLIEEHKYDLDTYFIGAILEIEDNDYAYVALPVNNLKKYEYAPKEPIFINYVPQYRKSDNTLSGGTVVRIDPLIRVVPEQFDGELL